MKKLLKSPLLRGCLFTAWLTSTSCATPRTETSEPQPLQPANVQTQNTPRATAESCPASIPAAELMPNVKPEHLRLDAWMQRMDADEILMTPQEIASHNRAIRAWPEEQSGALQDLTKTMSDREPRLERRYIYFKEQFEQAVLVEASGQKIDPEHWKTPPQFAPLQTPQIHVALEQTTVHCLPTTSGFYKSPIDLKFDRNRCSGLKPQEPFDLVGELEAFWLVRSETTFGFISKHAPISPTLTAAQANDFLTKSRLETPRDVVLEGMALKKGSLLVQGEDANHVELATASGLKTVALQETWASTARPLTRRAFFEAAFERLGVPYGWGDLDGNPDCSRFVSDLFARFGLTLPRHSADQAMAGEFSIDVSGVKSEEERLRILDEAAKKGIVLIQFPGHIMIYLGRDADGRPMAIHSFSEYLEPCATPTGDRKETAYRVDRVAVSDLELGRGTSRRAFVERMTRLTVLGKAPGDKLGGAELRQAAPIDLSDGCPSAGKAGLFISPISPHPDAPMNAIFTSWEELGPTAITVRSPKGEITTLPMRAFGGPPYGWSARIEQPETGTYLFALGDGERIHACRKVLVKASPEPLKDDFTLPDGKKPAWAVRESWGPKTEAFFSIFVESLFDYPDDDERTWPNLDALLQDREHNLLYGHLGQNEDEKLNLAPDCADLPYFLRGYFAWKLGLPFGFHQCTRSREGRPAQCMETPVTNLDARQSDSKPAQTFLRRKVMSGIHSSTARTLPQDEATDLYPVPLDRRSLRPGTVYADPYGHTLVVIGYHPQTATEYGVLMAADAQPDALIGRRRFWRGSFLFTPKTDDVGSGFKAFRPATYDHGQVGFKDNASLEDSKTFSPYSMQQYQGSKDDFYAAVEAVENPRPLDPNRRLDALLAALDEVVQRRVQAVQMGEDYMAAHQNSVVPMPKGAEIFLTSGPWEDFATPSRDLRLLISIDTVVDFPKTVARNPERFGIPAAEAESAVQALQERLDAGLRNLSVTYLRSDRSPFTISLAELVSRAETLEIAYNLNDCTEHRWGARPGTDEYATCNRRSPAGQKQQMERVRDWFRTRERPAR